MNRDIMNRFSMNPVNLDISRSKFNRNHGVKFSFNVGDVVPFYIDEILPGDTVSIDTSKVVRVQPLVTPIMDDLFLDTYYFFIPNRLIWSHWKQFMGENTETAWTPDVTYTIPQITIPSNGFAAGTIADYMGIPINHGSGLTISALPFRAYALVMNEWFRDENLQNPVHVFTDDTTRTGSNGSDQVNDIEKSGKPFIAAKYHDYFTSALPSPQRGPSVSFSLGGDAPVVPRINANNLLGKGMLGSQTTGVSLVRANDQNSQWVSNTIPGKLISQYTGSKGSILYDDQSQPPAGSGYPVAFNNLVADLNNTAMFNINELRIAFAVQRFYERSARSGSRYTEFIRGFFNVTSPDARQQRPEYLGGNRLPLNVSQVEQTSATQSGLTPQGNLTGISHTADNNSDFTKSFTEHGYILGVCVVRYNHTYQNGVEKHWLRKTNFDYYNPVFANLGEMAIDEKEIYFGASSNGVFGYQEAWADYRYKPSRVAGEMRSAATNPLDMWHLADNYTSKPFLSSSWIREDKSMLDRCLAVTSDVANQLIADFYIKATFARPMPLYSIPGLIDHH